ncbi:cytochrome P450 [Mollisia scopiformis]|uniref:Cytochrome P450 n=1 Tax=Mollisia scopiformis TaxID=149040 RepID=A0A194X0P8_MOLSC|nr:cytochrome P450 [Mollisia scopiformis]KUJ13765.1 cytochrome P450 [Mollisia scopiformis]
MAKQMRDPIQLRYHVLGPFFPGRDGTTIAESNVQFQLAHHPNYWTQLRKQSLKETIRTTGPVARVWRVSLKDTVLPLGGGPDQKMIHNKDVWGDDVEEFKPERWIGRKPMWEFVCFWGGPRLCAAQQQVYTYVIYAMVRLTQRFESIENCDPVYEYVEGLMPSIESVNGVKVAFKNS